MLILPFITHAMSPTEYGAASMLTAASMLLIAILAGPLDTLVLRTVPRGGEEAPGLLRVAGVYCYILLPVTAALVATGFALFVPTFLDVPGSLWAIEILAIGLNAAMTMFALPMVKARQDLPRFVWLAGSSIVFVAVSKLMLLVVWQLGVLGWVISDLISAVLSAAVAMALVRPPRARVTLDHVRAVARFAVPLIPHHALIWAIFSLSLPALASVSTLAQVGLLSISLSVASTASFALLEINRAVQPRYSRETFPAPTRTHVCASEMADRSGLGRTGCYWCRLGASWAVDLRRALLACVRTNGSAARGASRMWPLPHCDQLPGIDRRIAAVQCTRNGRRGCDHTGLHFHLRP